MQTTAMKVVKCTLCRGMELTDALVFRGALKNVWMICMQQIISSATKDVFGEI